MKKILLILLTLTLLNLTGCGSQEQEQPTKIGTLTKLNAAPEDNLNFYDNFNSMQMALDAKNIAAIRTYGSVAKYMTDNNADFVVTEVQSVQLDNFCFAMREGDNNLRNEFDNAIDVMKADGSLDDLTKLYIDNPNYPIEAVDMPTIDGAETIRVAITGDLPPLDFVNPDGKPAGFNTAVLAKIAKIIGKNIEMIQVDSSARGAALTSGQVDVIFWVVVPAEENSSRPKDFDTPEGVEVTEPYYQDKVTHVTLAGVAAAF